MAQGGGRHLTPNQDEGGGRQHNAAGRLQSGEGSADDGAHLLASDGNVLDRDDIPQVHRREPDVEVGARFFRRWDSHNNLWHSQGLQIFGKWLSEPLALELAPARQVHIPRLEDALQQLGEALLPWKAVEGRVD